MMSTREEKPQEQDKVEWEAQPDTSGGNQKRQPCAAEQESEELTTRPEISAEDLAALEAKAAESDRLKDQLLRARAEFENLRKTLSKERQAAQEAAIAEFAADLFFVLDDLERTLDHLDTERKDEPLVQGVILIRNKLLKVLSDRDIRPIKTEGQLFDPAYHEAVAVEATDALEPNRILEEVRKGYVMGSRLIRPAQVRVAVPAKSDEQPAEEQ